MVSRICTHAARHGAASSALSGAGDLLRGVVGHQRTATIAPRESSRRCCNSNWWIEDDSVAVESRHHGSGSHGSASETCDSHSDCSSSSSSISSVSVDGEQSADLGLLAHIPITTPVAVAVAVAVGMARRPPPTPTAAAVNGHHRNQQ